ncbi:hypothetical protein ABMY20_09825 [Tenacibaculum sp. SSH1-16]|uniref:hypothetical protein n=1 Tax=Tenacibaculum TaxID=104267 RepID=UPI00064AC8EE|nr:hypothetical protein [Tenacibaculum mesophilum]BFF37829.1 hypothetical protein BACT7_26910 [Tenacibaculum mesophilum]
MKIVNSIFKVLGYVIILGGLGTLIVFALYPSQDEWEYYTQEAFVEEQYITEDITEKKSKKVSSVTKTVRSKNTVSLTGKWKVVYKSLNGSVVYVIKREGKIYNAFTYEVQDENGYGEKVPLEKNLIIKYFNGKKGKGTYKVEFEGKKYDIPCKINLKDNNTFLLSYDYYGYNDTEVWKREN